MIVRIPRDGPLPWSVAEGDGRVYFTITPDEAACAELNLATGRRRQLGY